MVYNWGPVHHSAFALLFYFCTNSKNCVDCLFEIGIIYNVKLSFLEMLPAALAWMWYTTPQHFFRIHYRMFSTHLQFSLSLLSYMHFFFSSIQLSSSSELRWKICIHLPDMFKIRGTGYVFLATVALDFDPYVIYMQNNCTRRWYYIFGRAIELLTGKNKTV